MKIAVIGYSGSGKSTLARKLSARFSVPVLHLDSVHFLPDWQERDSESEQSIVSDFMINNDGWVIDGIYSRLSYDRRMQEADMIVMLLFNRFSSFARAYGRYRANKGRTRADMADGCNEKFDFEFAKWILYEGRTKKRRERFKILKKAYPEKVTVLKNQRQINGFEKSLNIKQGAK